MDGVFLNFSLTSEFNSAETFRVRSIYKNLAVKFSKYVQKEGNIFSCEHNTADC